MNQQRVTLAHFAKVQHKLAKMGDQKGRQVCVEFVTTSPTLQNIYLYILMVSRKIFQFGFHFIKFKEVHLLWAERFDGNI